MSSNLPLRTIRIPALRQQCLFRRRRSLQLPRAFSTTAPQAFAATSTRLARGESQFKQEKGATKAAARNQQGWAPRVTEMKAQKEGDLAEDIGLLQDTVIRASWTKLPRPWNPTFWSYVWKLTKSWATGMYSRSVYKRCIYHKGWARFLPIDFNNHKQVRTIAKTLYAEIYANFAKGDMSDVSKFCLPPLLENFDTRIKARGPITMDWSLIGGMKAKVVSHRASLFGEEQPDTAFRQVVVRIKSTQRLQIDFSKEGAKGTAPNATKSSAPKGFGGWVPLDVKKQQQIATKDKSEQKKEMETEMEGVEIKDSGTAKKVVEYLVLQRRVKSGVEDPEWKVWGFAQESTPERIEEDAEYWRKTLSATAG